MSVSAPGLPPLLSAERNSTVLKKFKCHREIEYRNGRLVGARGAERAQVLLTGRGVGFLLGRGSMVECGSGAVQMFRV